MKKALIIANGPNYNWQELINPYQQDIILVLDGAYNSLLYTDLPIHSIIGDMDSISSYATKHALEKHITLIKQYNQNKTDLHKAIDYLDTVENYAITIVKGTDGRTDHTLHNLQQLSKLYRDQRPITLLTATERINVVKDNEVTVQGNSGEGISLIGAPHAIVTSTGLVYDLNDATIAWCESDSTSNTLKKNYATISVKGMVLLIQQHSLENHNEIPP